MAYSLSPLLSSPLLTSLFYIKREEGKRWQKLADTSNTFLRVSKCLQHTQGACSSVALAGFALPECPGSSPHVYPAHEGLTAVVHRGLVPLLSRVRPSMCTPVTPAVPYLLLGLQDVQWGIVVVRVSWPGHPTWIKKKKKCLQHVMLLYSYSITAFTCNETSGTDCFCCLRRGFLRPAGFSFVYRDSGDMHTYILMGLLIIEGDDHS